jgi:cytochrome c oxidase subunit 2
MIWQDNSVLWIVVGAFGAICLFILALLARTMLTRGAPSRPAPSDAARRTRRELIWTVAPVLAFALVAVPSVGFVYLRNTTPAADLTITVTGHMWYWTYKYSDAGDFTFRGPMIANSAAEKLPVTSPSATDDHIIVPVDKTVRIVAIATNVIYSWAIPSLGARIEAVPGWNGQTWFRAAKEGRYYGNCSELCGLPHTFKPVEIEVVSQARFDKWVAESNRKLSRVVASASAGQ